MTSRSSPAATNPCWPGVPGFFVCHEGMRTSAPCVPVEVHWLCGLMIGYRDPTDRAARSAHVMNRAARLACHTALV